ncbi:YoaK family protein [Methylobacterium sp. GC_Met_2]|uniref:YoaK family protein n=1 Tax=Methylobacterium sp. GC_Met_2 TaxID=2937376 RepID=UPI00226B6E03
MNRIHQLGLGLLLTGLAGYVDALGFVRLGGLYTSFMSGNTTQLAVFGAAADPHRMVLPAILIFAFLTGSVLGSGLAILVPPRWTTPAVLAYESLLILGGLGLGLESPELGLAAFFVAVAMGSQNAVLAQVKGFRAGTTFVTGALFSLGHKIAQALTRTGDPLGWVGDGLVWLSLLLGAYLGAHAYGLFALYALIAPAALSGGLALVTAIVVLRAGPHAAKVPAA